MKDGSTQVSVEGDNLLLPDGSNIQFPFNIGQAITVNDVIVVRLEVPSGSACNENVFGLTRSGKALWKIPLRPHVYPDSPYVDVRQDGFCVRVANYDGEYLWLDPATGQITRTIQTK